MAVLAPFSLDFKKSKMNNAQPIDLPKYLLLMLKSLVNYLKQLKKPTRLVKKRLQTVL